jgi:hypothetical protein
MKWIATEWAWFSGFFEKPFVRRVNRRMDMRPLTLRVGDNASGGPFRARLNIDGSATALKGADQVQFEAQLAISTKFKGRNRPVEDRRQFTLSRIMSWQA